MGRRAATASTVLTLGLVLFCGAAGGAAFFDPDSNAIFLRDYPPELPCILRRLAELDRLFGWDRVTYDSNSATCTIACDLIIGSNDGTDTVLQVGSPAVPNETLVMRGNIYIAPYYVFGENEGEYYRVPKRMNALVLGSKAEPAVRASLLFACTPSEKYTLYCGRHPRIDGKTQQWGGGLYVYHSRITALRPEPDHEIGDARAGNMYLHGSVVLDHAEISWVKNWLYGLGPGHVKDYLLKDTLFEHIGGAPLLNGRQVALNCTFRNCGTAVKDFGSLDAELTGCRFEGNARNWSLAYTDKGLVCVDCQWDTPRDGNEYRMREQGGKRRYPYFISRRHVVVEVTGPDGAPIGDASITFRAEQEGCGLLQHFEYRTDKDGRTPGPGQEDALLLTEFIRRATDTADEPDTTAFTYTLRASAPGFAPGTIEQVRAQESWQVVRMVLERQ